MAKLTINIGSAANDGTGDPIRTAFSKVNSNFTEVYDAIDGLATVAGSGEYEDLNNRPTLGSAAALDAGTNAFNVVQLDSEGKLPAIDGSNLTGIEGGGGGGGITNIEDDATPTLGGDLELDGHSVGDATPADLTKLSELTATSTELNYVDGVTSAIQTQLDGKVDESLFDAHTILAATSDDTPVALTVAEDTIVGRATGGSIDALTATEVRTILNVEDGATADMTGSEIAAALESSGDLSIVDAADDLDSAEAAALIETGFLARTDSENRSWLVSMHGAVIADGETHTEDAPLLGDTVEGEFKYGSLVPVPFATLDEYLTGTDAGTVFVSVDVMRYMGLRQVVSYSATTTLLLDGTRTDDGDGTDSNSLNVSIAATGNLDIRFNSIHSGLVGEVGLIRITNSDGGAKTLSVTTANGITVDANDLGTPTIGSSSGDYCEILYSIVTTTLVRLEKFETN